jgi:enoyl-CoA hydratase
VPVDYQTLRLSSEAPIARITLARPQEANRVGMRMLREISDACDDIAANQNIAFVVLNAEGEHFCAGWTPEARETLQSSFDQLDPFGCLAALPVPVLAVLRGTVASAGLELALACDMRVAATGTRFSMPEVTAGQVPLAGATARLPRIAGRSIASAMLLMGEELDAQDAYRCGLISRVFEVEKVREEVDALVNRVTANGPLGLRYAKEAVHNGIELPLDQALRYELDLSIILQTTRDRAEGVEAFLQKREPRFEGQ